MKLKIIMIIIAISLLILGWLDTKDMEFYVPEEKIIMKNTL